MATEAVSDGWYWKFRLSWSQGISSLRTREFIVTICWLRVFVVSILTSVAIQRVIWMPLYVSFDLSFISIYIKDIVEIKGELWHKGRSLYLSINICSYQCNRVQFVNCSFFTCVNIMLEVMFWSSVYFFEFCFIKNSNIIKHDC